MLHEQTKGYVWMEPDQSEVLQVRELNKPIRLIGSIINHCVFLVALLFVEPSGVNRVIDSLKRKPPGRRQINPETIYQELAGHVERAWKVIREDFQLSNEQMLKIIETVALDLF